MRNDARFALRASRVFAVLAIVAGIGASLFQALFGSAVCFDYCPSPADYFPQLFPILGWILVPCIILALLALWTFLWYCRATEQRRRASKQVIFFLVGGVIGAAVLGGLLLMASIILPVTSDGILVEQPLERWTLIWGLAVLLVVAGWTGILARLSWPAE